MPALTDPWALGGRTLENRLVLAPLAGIGNWFVRLQAKRFGAGLVTSEMVSSFGLAYGNERTVKEFLRIHPEEHPVSIQLFGHDAAVMREAAAMAAAAGADLIDLNMGCPVRKVCKTGAGAALLRTRPKRWPSPTPPERAAGSPSPRSCVPGGPPAIEPACTWRSGWRAKRASPGSPSTPGTPRSSTPAAPTMRSHASWPRPCRFPCSCPAG
jgi:hypothetical protein